MRVRAVREAGDGRLPVESDAGHWTARALINATGTWTRPFIPAIPGAADFRGRQLHSSQYLGPQEFAGRRVLVVGGGASAIQVLAETAAVAETLWVTRRPPVFREDRFTPAKKRPFKSRLRRTRTTRSGLQA